MTEDTPRIDRRRVLASLAAAGAGGLAGCPSVTINIGGDGGDGGGGDGGGVFDGSSDGESGSDGGDDPSGDVSCTDVTNGYERQEVGERPILFDFEYPAIFDEPVYTQAGEAAFYEAQRATGEDGSVEMVLTQTTDPEESADTEGGGASETTTTFNGEEVEFVGSSSGSALLWGGNLPYEFEGERQTFPAVLDLSASEESNECGDALREAAEHIVDSMELNPDTTLG